MSGRAGINARRGSPSALKGIAYRLASSLVLAGMFALVKALGSRYPIGEIVFARNLFALVPITWLVHSQGKWAELKTKHPLLHMRRAIAGTLALFFSFSAVTMLPLSTAVALTYAAPLFITVMSTTLLQEQVSPRRWIAVGLGFFGVLTVVRPDFSAGLPLGKLLGVLGAIASAASLIYIRQMSTTEPDFAIAFHYTVFGIVVGAMSLTYGVVIPNVVDAAKLVAIGLLGGIAQMLVTRAYRLAPASLLAPVEYATLLSSLLIGYLAWGDTPAMMEWIGIAIIVGAGLLPLLPSNPRAIARSAIRMASKRRVR
ncbi:DMT family transporter [Roseateles flavus]|uniref:DMT family transporter n=1 Tax=Roseateles flavus TaxID=3149041 RepID=A0ABV0GKN3_9BURK